MLTFFRTRSRAFLIILLIVIGISFLFLYNASSLDGLKRAELGRIDGKSVSQDQYRLAYQATKLWDTMTEGSRRRGASGDILHRQAWNRLLILSTAKKSGFTASDAEVTDFIKTKLPFLQKENQFDPTIWAQFSGSNGYLASQGVSAERFIEIIREELTQEKLQTSLTSPIHVSPSEVRETFEKLFSPVKFQVIKFESKTYLAQVKVTNEEIEKEYKDNESNPAYRTPERRVVAYAKFEFTPEQLKAKDAEKEEAKRLVAEKAAAFAVALQGDGTTPPDFDTVAKNQNVPSVVTKPFALRETVEGLPPSPTFNRAAFRLVSDAPYSEPVETPNGFYVLHLKDVQPSVVKSLPEIRTVVEENLKNRKAAELAAQAGSEASTQLKITYALTKDFVKAASSLKLKAEDIPEFTPGEVRSPDPILRVISPLAGSNQPGDISGYENGPGYGVIAFFKERGKTDEKKFGDISPNLVTQLENQRKSQVLDDWFTKRYSSPGTKLPPEVIQPQAQSGL